MTLTLTDLPARPTRHEVDVAAAPLGPSADAARVARARRFAVLAWLGCAGAYLWLVSAGHVAWWPQYTARYGMMADGFLKGQLHLTVRANPKHLALPDPYDPVANDKYRHVPGVPDSCLYNGRFYLYWGPVPGLLMVPVKFLHGLGTVGDHYLVFGFALGLLACTAALLCRIYRKSFADQPPWTVFVAVIAAGLATPLPCLLTRAAVYEAAILGGQFFLMAGMYAAYVALDDSRPRPRAGWLFAAGTCWAAAVGCRVSLAVAVGVLGAWVVWRVVRSIGVMESRSDRVGEVPAGPHSTTARLSLPKSPSLRHSITSALLPLLAFALPAAAGAVALGAYNHARFGSWHEFGQKYQLANVNLHAYPSLFGVDNVPPGLWSYFFRPVAVIHSFPFVVAQPGDGQFPAFVRLPDHYETYEPISGILMVSPFLWLGLGCLRRGTRAGALPPLGNAGTRPRSPTGVHLVAGVLGFAPVLFMIGSTQRYLADLTPSLTIVAAVGMWRLGARPAVRRLAYPVAVAFAVLSVGVGVLMSIEGYSGHFRYYNPDLFQRLGGPSSGTDAAQGGAGH